MVSSWAIWNCCTLNSDLDKWAPGALLGEPILEVHSERSPLPFYKHNTSFKYERVFKIKKLLTNEQFLSLSIFFTGDLKHSVPIEGTALDNISAKSVEDSNPAADSRAIIISSK